MIFSFSRSTPKPHLGSLDVHRQNLSIVRLTAVCSHWRSVAIEHALLWSNIAFTTSILPTINCATIFLQRSKGTSLHVHIWDVFTTRCPPLLRPTRSALSNLLSLISSQRNRIVFLEVIEPSVGVFDALQGPAENVTKVVIQGRTPRQRLDPFSGKLPNIRQITLIHPGPCRLRTLTYLTQVTLHSGSRKWTFEGFLDCVDGCSSLRSLSIIRYLDFPDQGKDTTRTVSLPSLTDLHLDTCDTATILDHLKIPATASVSIGIDIEYVPNFNNAFSCMPRKTDRINFLRDTRSLTVVFDRSRGDFHISGFKGRTPVFLFQLRGSLTQLDDGWVHRSLEAATNILPFSQITSLALVADNAHVPWDSWLRQCGRLSALDVRCADTRDLVAVLNRTQNDNPLCHTLKELSISSLRDSPWNSYASLLKSTIRSRKRQGSPLSRLAMTVSEWDVIRRIDPSWVELVRRQGTRPYA